MPPFTSEGVYPASHQACGSMQPRFLPSTQAQGGKEQLHHPPLPVDRPAEDCGEMTWTPSPREEQVLTNFRRNGHVWVFQWNRNRGCTNAMLCSAGSRTLSSGAVALPPTQLHCLMCNTRDRDMSKQRASLQVCWCLKPSPPTSRHE